MSPTFRFPAFTDDGIRSSTDSNITTIQHDDMPSHLPYAAMPPSTPPASRLAPECAMRASTAQGEARYLEWSDIPSPSNKYPLGQIQLVYSQIFPRNAGETSVSASDPASDPENMPPRLHEVAACLWRQLYAAIQWEHADDAPEFVAPPGQLVFVLAKPDHVSKILQQHQRFVLRQLDGDGQVVHSWYYQDPVLRPHQPTVMSIGVSGVPYGYPAARLRDILPDGWYRWGKINSIWYLRAHYPECRVRGGHTGLAVIVLECARGRATAPAANGGHTSALAGLNGHENDPSRGPEVWNHELERLIKELPTYKATYGYPHAWSPKLFCLDQAWETEMSWVK